MPAQRLTGAEIVVDHVDHLVRNGVRHAAGIPGHGCWTLTDALLDRSDEITSVQVRHEQSAVHLADGYHRAGGPSLAHVKVDRDLAVAGPDKTGWWDVPVPEGRPAYADQAAVRAEEQHR